MVNTYDFTIDLKKGIDIKDVTHLIQKAVMDSSIDKGVANITSIGSTASITTIEYEPGVVEDLKSAISELAPPDRYYEHEKAWHDGNGHSHVQSALLGPSVSIPVRGGRLALGTWQQIVVINHDIHPRKRKICVTIIGS